MSRGKPGLKSMSEEERRAYYLDASRRWRERHPDYYERVGKPRRLAKLAAETPEEREARRTKERQYREANRERFNELARERRRRDPEKEREKERALYARDIEKSRAIAREKASRYYQKRKAGIVAHNRKRRALQSGAAGGETIRHLVVAERDGWVCHLCGGSVTKKDWSIDHLVPLARGGPHTYANVRLAHRICNVRRGDRPVTGSRVGRRSSE